MARTGGRRGHRAAHRTRTTARSLAVALVLTAGVVATVATSPAPDEPCPAPDGEISSFYGVQGDKGPRKTWDGDGTVTAAGPFEVYYLEANVRACVAEDAGDGATGVEVTFTLGGDVPASVVDLYVQGAVLTDGRGREWEVVDLSVEEGRDLSDDSREFDVELTFELPLDVPEPVRLQLPAFDSAPDDLPKPLRIGPFGPEPSPTPTLSRIR